LIEILLEKNEKKFSEHNATIFLSVTEKSETNQNDFHSAITSMTMFAPNQNMFIFAVSQKSRLISV